MNALPVIRVERLELDFCARPWPFADERKSEIEHHFERIKRVKPATWNGRVLLLRDPVFDRTAFRGAYFETDFASFMAWRDWDFPDPTVVNCFSLGAVRGSDGGFLLGVMGPHTINAGKIYFPAGTPEPADVSGGKVDLAANIMREIAEETGLERDTYAAEEGWHCVLAGQRIAVVSILQADETAGALRERALGHLAQQKRPELADIRIARGPSDLDPMMPPFMQSFLKHVWS